jgi:hypothetical protein
MHYGRIIGQPCCLMRPVRIAGKWFARRSDLCISHDACEHDAG